MFKQVKVIMLPSKEMTRKGDLTFFGNKLVIASSVLHLAQVSQNLYFLSDEEIKEGDWCYDKVLNIVFQTDKYTDFKYVNQTDNVSKVIATTDKSLSKTIKSNYIQFGDKVEETKIEFLPQTPQSFIEHFVSEYNKGNIITEVEVEYEPDRPKNSTHYVMGSFNWQLKINSDNTINIKPIKDSWSREEVESILHMIVNDSHCSINRVKHANSNECAGFVNKWIEQNL